MNKFVKEQLNKCRTQLPEWDDNTVEMVITGNSVVPSVIDDSGILHICIENYIINEPPNFTLSSNSLILSSKRHTSLLGPLP